MKSQKKIYDVIITGGGAAGLMAAYKASGQGLSTVLLEKNNILGKKLLITGKGRCNVTNNCDDVDTLVSNCIHNGRFLYSSFQNFSNHDIINFFEKYNLKMKTERGRRVFPVTDNASDVVKVLENAVRKNNVDIRLNTSVKKILVQNSSIQGVVLSNNKRILGKKVILATGGMSYPDTGSSGDGYEMSKMLGHTVKTPAPALVPLETEEKWVSEAMGLSLRNAGVTFMDSNDRIIYRNLGEMLFTHFGLSGPVVLSGSSHIESEKIKVVIDLKPALNFEKLDRRLQRDFDKNKNKQFKNSLNELLPKKLIDIIVRLSEIPPDKKVNQISKSERSELVYLLKNLTLNIKRKRPLEEAIVTRGGIDIKEINPKTMESKIIPGLYFAGEIIDADAYTGGFNLTIAFSTGACAGLNK